VKKGEVLLDNQNIQHQSTKEVAKKIAILRPNPFWWGKRPYETSSSTVILSVTVGVWGKIAIFYLHYWKHSQDWLKWKKEKYYLIIKTFNINLQKK
jgi:hypothetical protein